MLLDVVVLPDITLQQIETFLAVAEQRCFSAAAKSLYISQPALSKIIRRFENSIGSQLFVRKNHRIELTKEGEYLYTEFEPLYSKMNQTLLNVGRLSDAPGKVLRLACHTSYNYTRDFSSFGRTVRQYKEKYPNITVNEELFEFNELRNVLIVGDVDVIFAVSFVFADLKIASFKKIEEHEFHIIMSVNHPLASGEELPIARLSGETFFFVSTNENEFELCAQVGFTPKNIIHLRNFPSVMNAVRQGRGMTICGNAVATLDVNDLKSYRIQGIPNPTYLGVAWRTDDVSKEALDFIAMLPG
jgi:DNA-binding transcriptional LysR family regulator